TDIAEIFSKSNTKTQILAASFKTAKEVLDVAVAGCHAATIGSTIMQMLITHTTTDTSIAGFDRDWREAFGEESLLERLEKKA
ncbi:MAG: fructose-6-phosphate aldolase, partial [Clostridia bacterium]|nr:fructose-6-phosphate aldolase [Clostridia bacterium]